VLHFYVTNPPMISLRKLAPPEQGSRSSRNPTSLQLGKIAI
jgi:hypothetical protein